MKRKGRMTLFLALVLLLGAIAGAPYATAESKQSAEQIETDNKTEDNPTSAEKEEVVYASLSADGKVENVYVVNLFDVDEGGKITDYGAYDTVRNLTDTTLLEQEGDTVSFSAGAGRFSYQGNFGAVALPWRISIVYLLDGKAVSPEELGGASGHLEIQIQISEDDTVDPSFYENDLLQISLSLDSALCSEITAPDATIANAGSLKQITFMAMPGKGGTYTLEAEVTDFEMDGVSIAAMPLNLPIEIPDVSEWSGDLQSLSDAIAALDDGVGTLQEGITELNDGVGALKDGSTGYQNGITAISAQSSTLVNASATIQEALTYIESSLDAGAAGGLDLSSMAVLPDTLSQIADGLRTSAEELSLLDENYGAVFDALDQAVALLPAETLPEEELMQLLQANPDNEVLNRLLEAYNTALMVKTVYEQGKPVFEATRSAFPALESALGTVADTLDTVADGVEEALQEMDFSTLTNGLEALCSQYGQFHDGLVAYTDGVNSLSEAYRDMDSGIQTLKNGTDALDSGVEEFGTGTGELRSQTDDLPEMITSEIEKLTEEYDKSDYVPVSFASSKNGTVRSVQFVIQSEAIQKPLAEEETDTVEEEENFWTRFLALFS